MNARGAVNFTKLEALGNDFVLIDARSGSFAPDRAAISHLGDRHRGIGYDQMLVLQPSSDDGCHCHVAIWNSDGNKAEQCGNGMRAVALWLHRRGEIRRQACLSTPAGPVDVQVDSADAISATLGVPEFTPTACGLDVPGSFPWRTEVAGERLEIYGCSLGNPHLLVVQAAAPEEGRLHALGEALGTHPALSAGANLGLAACERRDRIHLRVFERGAGATLACGSGACAAAANMIRLGMVRESVEVVQPGGTVVVNWPGEGHPVRMTGPARQVFEGVIAWPTSPT